MTKNKITELPTLYTKTSKKSTNYWKIQVNNDKVISEWGQVGGTPLYEEYTAVGMNLGKANETSPAEQALLEAQSKYNKKLRMKYSTSVEDTEKLNIKPMLAHTLVEKTKLTFPLTVQPKLNGVRCLAYNLPDGSVRLMSRGGKDYVLPHIQTGLKRRLEGDFVLDGELYKPETPLQTIRHLIDQEDESITFCVYDCTWLGKNQEYDWTARMGVLGDWFSKNHSHKVRPVSNIVVNVREGITKYHKTFCEDGYEGTIVRLHDGVYTFGHRSRSLLKHKDFQDEEFPIIGWRQGKDEGSIFTCLLEDDITTFDVKMTGTAEEQKALEEKWYTWQGQLLTVKFQERSVDNVPIFPVGMSIRPREDK